MKTSKIYFLALALIAITATTFTSCKKGTDDPVISLKSRNDRFTNTWTLTKYEKNGTTQSLDGTTYIFNVSSNGTLVRTVEGTLFGFATRSVENGTWEFLNDDEDVRITIDSKASIYNIQRLASSELWLKEVIKDDTYFYYFTGK